MEIVQRCGRVFETYIKKRDEYEGNRKKHD
jgi:hypothetical protein